MNAPTGIIDIRGKQYLSVALRVQMFRERFPSHGLTTEVIERDADCVVMKAIISAEDGRILATGHSEEYRKSSQINRTSALENAETSAIGRALAAFGFGGTEFSSANEVQNAIHQQQAGDGHSGSDREVSHPPAEPIAGETRTVKPARWTEDSPLYPNATKLHKGLTSLERELAGCGDSEMVYGLTASVEWVEFVRVAGMHAPHYLTGGEPAPEEFEGLIRTAERMVREFDTDTAQQRVATFHT